MDYLQLKYHIYENHSHIYENNMAKILRYFWLYRRSVKNGRSRQAALLPLGPP